MPIFGGFLNFLDEKTDMSRTIMAVVSVEDFDRIIIGIEGITGDLGDHAHAAVFATDLAFSKGLREHV